LTVFVCGPVNPERPELFISAANFSQGVAATPPVPIASVMGFVASFAPPALVAVSFAVYVPVAM